MTAAHPLRPTFASPVTGFANAGFSQYGGQTSGTPFTAWTEIVPENLSRREGVWVQCSNATAAILHVRPSSSDPTAGVNIGFKVKAAYTSTTALDNDDVLFIPGTSAVWAKDSAEAAAINYIAWEH